MGIGNVMVGQSGGPTSVINASLAGVYRTARELGAPNVYGMLNGVEGLIDGKCVDLSKHIRSGVELELLKRTPASFLGTCRYKLKDVAEKEEDYAKIFAHMRKRSIESLFYLGGNDSMDSIYKLTEYAKAVGANINIIGVPKTIDNDLEETDHTPGFGSAAKYIASTVKEVVRDAYAFNQKSVVIVEIMGRNAGWLTASALMARGEDNPGPDLILVPEVPFDQEDFLKYVGHMLLTKKNIVVAVSEGLCDTNGVPVGLGKVNEADTDAFGHATLSGAGEYLKRILSEELGVKRVRSIEFSAVQRCAAHLSSKTDVDEAFLAGVHAVRAAAAGETAKVVVFNRVSNDPYSITIKTSHVKDVANVERKLPEEWIDRSRYYITDDFIEYARPLILGEVSPYMVDGVPRHLVLNRNK